MFSCHNRGVRATQTSLGGVTKTGGHCGPPRVTGSIRCSLVLWSIVPDVLHRRHGNPLHRRRKRDSLRLLRPNNAERSNAARSNHCCGPTPQGWSRSCDRPSTRALSYMSGWVCCSSNSGMQCGCFRRCSCWPSVRLRRSRRRSRWARHDTSSRQAVAVPTSKRQARSINCCRATRCCSAEPHVQPAHSDVTERSTAASLPAGLPATTAAAAVPNCSHSCAGC